MIYIILKKNFLKIQYKNQLVVRLKAIKCKKTFFALYFFISYLLELFY